MPRPTPRVEPRTGPGLTTAAIVIGSLYFGRDILLPLALSVLLSFLLAPLVTRLEQLRIGRIASVLIVATSAILLFGVLSFVVGRQFYDLAYKLPDYKENIRAKLNVFQGDSTGLWGQVSKSLEELRSNVSKGPAQTKLTEPGIDSSTIAGETQANIQEPVKSAVKTPALASPDEIVRVQVVESLTAKQIAQSMLGPLISPLASGAVVIVFVIFMLLQREDLRNRFIHLIGGERLSLTTQALDDAGRRVSRYLLMQLIINSIFGFVVAVGLTVIGLPNALLWGVLATLLRFVPYAGPFVAAIIPFTISMAVFDGWSRPVVILILFLINEMVASNVIEPWLYGASTGISTTGIIVTTVFWGWIWGPVGLVMATPLTVCLTVVGKYVPQLGFLNTLFSEEEVLPVHSRFYQRLLALDPEEATEVAEDYLAANSLEELYDRVLLPALSLAENDRHHGDLDEEKQLLVHQTTRDIVEELGERFRKSNDASGNIVETVSLNDPFSNRGIVLCVPAHDDADEIAELMLAQLLEHRGVPSKVVSAATLSGEMMDIVSSESIATVCVSAVPPLAATHARYICKRLKPKFPDLKIVVGLWQTNEISKKTQDRLGATGIDRLVGSLSEAAEELKRLSQNAVAAARDTSLKPAGS